MRAFRNLAVRVVAEKKHSIKPNALLGRVIFHLPSYRIVRGPLAVAPVAEHHQIDRSVPGNTLAHGLGHSPHLLWYGSALMSGLISPESRAKKDDSGEREKSL